MNKHHRARDANYLPINYDNKLLKRTLQVSADGIPLKIYTQNLGLNGSFPSISLPFIFQRYIYLPFQITQSIPVLFKNL